MESGNSLEKRFPGGGYTPSYWETSQDPDIPFDELGFHTWAMSLPDGWNFSAERIARERREGRDKIRRLIRGLVDRRLMKVERVRDDKGQWITKTAVYAVAYPQVSPATENQAPEETPGQPSDWKPGPGEPGPGESGPGESGAGTPGGRETQRPENQALKNRDSTDQTLDNPSSSSVSPTAQTARGEDEEEPKPEPDPLSDATLLMSQIEANEQHTRADLRHQETDPEIRSHAVVAGLNWRGWGQPRPEELPVLHKAIRAAFRFGWTVQHLTNYANTAIERAKVDPVPYLIRALTPRRDGGWLTPPPPQMRDKPHTMSATGSTWRDVTPVDPATTEKGIQAVRQALRGRTAQLEVTQ